MPPKNVHDVKQNIEYLLPQVRGRYSFAYELAKLTWFQTGGPCDVLYKPSDIEDLLYFLNHIPKNIPLSILGAGSNVLIRDGGISGVVIKLGSAFSKITINENHIYAGAACLDRTLAMHMQDAGIAGFEFLVGIPGTIGGAVKMNAGAYGGEICDLLLYADAIDPDGNLHQLSTNDLGFSYRHSSVVDGWIIVGAAFKKQIGDPLAIHEKINNILEQRKNTQPIRGRTGGSTFKNPPNHKAWELIDKAGCRGLTKGDAQVSNLHCNFLLNLNQASAFELESLGEEVKQRVFETSNVELEWEIIRLGHDK